IIEEINLVKAEDESSSQEPDFFECADGKYVISNELMCDGQSDCDDESDESEETCQDITCGEDAFRCKYGACVGKESLCDKIMTSIRALNYVLRRRSKIIPGIPLSSLSPYYYNTNSIIKRYASQKSTSEISKVDGNEYGNQLQTSFAEVVKENTKSAWYVSVIIAGVGVTALTFYVIFRELFSDKSPNGVYGKALDRCMKDPKVVDALGEPIKAFGEESRRGRRRHVNHAVFKQNGRMHMRMQFYIQGIRKRGTVYLEVCEDNSGKFVYRYLFVQLEDMFHSVIVVEDNRANEMQSNKIDDVTPFNIPVISQ
ncbi:hypothetical protein PV326_000963, partial [Microctonus aethiopoides]